MKLYLDIAGWLGSSLIVISYALTLAKTRDFSTICTYFNLAGAIMVAFNCFYYQAMPSFVTNLIWSGIAILSIIRARKQMLRQEKV